jgi:multidrug resistance efflux pump
MSDTARARAQAAVSKAQAQVTSLEVELARAEDELKASQAGGDLLDSVKDVKVVGDLTGGMRDQSKVDQDQVQAQVDELKAQLSAAQGKLDRAKTAQRALETVVGDDG